jgi:hypothetical protein
MLKPFPQHARVNGLLVHAASGFVVEVAEAEFVDEA